MGLFAPWFLAGLAGLALPVYLHLLKRQTARPKQVSSLMLFESRTQSSTRHRRLRYFLLLSLRLAMLLLLILAFANPFINRDAAAIASNRLVLLVVDNSFSMRAGTRLADAKEAAMRVLSGKGAARAQVAAFGSQLRFMTQPIEDQSALRAAVQAIEPGDGHGNFGELARAVRATGRFGPHAHRAAPVQRHAAQRSGRHLCRHGAARQRQAGDACRGLEGPAELDRGIGGRARPGVGQGRQARSTCGP